MTEDRNAQTSNSGSRLPQKPYPSFSVKNFGPIARGKIELRPLTVFAGPSNTGKSWMATLIYALGLSLSTDRYSLLPHFLSTLGHPATDPLGFPEDPVAWLDSISKGRPLVLTELDKKIIETTLKDKQADVEGQLLRCFGLPTLPHLVREGNVNPADVTVMTEETEQFVPTCYALKLSKEGKTKFTADILSGSLPVPSTNGSPGKPIDMRLHEILSAARDDSDGGDATHHHVLRSALLDQIVTSAFGGLGGTAFYLPADRGGIMHAHSVVVSTLIQNASRAGLSPTPSLPSMSGVLADFLGGLIDMATGEGRTRLGMFSPFLPSSLHLSKTAFEKEDLAKHFEDNLLEGHVGVDSSNTHYPRFTIRPKKWDRDLPLMNASSMVSELAPVVLYLRNLVKPGDLLILEEPESHLHPAMQVRFVQEISTFIQWGIRVLLTTHSEWVLGELTNIVARGEAGASRSAGDPALSKEQVGLWLFEHRDKRNTASGSQIREVEWAPDEGGFDAEYDTVAMKLHNVWVDLMGDSDE